MYVMTVIRNEYDEVTSVFHEFFEKLRSNDRWKFDSHTMSNNHRKSDF